MIGSSPATSVVQLLYIDLLNNCRGFAIVEHQHAMARKVVQLAPKWYYNTVIQSLVWILVVGL